MNKEEYMRQLKKKLKKLPKEDFERAVEYYEEYFADAGAENEAKAIEDLGSVQEAADAIICDLAMDYAKEPVRNMKKGLNALWVGVLAVCAAPVALPLFLTGIILVFCVLLVVVILCLAAMLVAISLLISGPLALVSSVTVVTKSIPVFLTCFGIGLMSTGIGALGAYALYLFCRKLLGWSVKRVGDMLRKGGNRHA